MIERESGARKVAALALLDLVGPVVEVVVVFRGHRGRGLGIRPVVPPPHHAAESFAPVTTSARRGFETGAAHG